MSYPTVPQSQIKMGKPASKLLLRPWYSSAWARHEGHHCLNQCHYCWMERRLLRPKALDALVAQAQELKMGY